MRKTILIGFSVFIIVVASSYCIAWFIQASQIRRGIENAIEQVNKDQKYITYEGMETSGFPFDIYISIIRPHFVGRVDPLLRAWQNAHPTGAITPALPEWNEDARLDGRVVIGINTLSDHYSLQINGGWQHSSKIGDQTLNTINEAGGDSICMLQMARSGGLFNNLWDYHALWRDNAQDFFKDLRLIDCSGYANTVSDAGSHEKLLSNGPWRFYISSDAKDANREVRFYTKLSDMEVTPQGDSMIASVRNALFPQMPYAVKYSLLGKQNAEIDFAYTGPNDWPAGSKNPPIDIKLSKFNITNQLYNSDITFFLSNGMNATNRAARVAFKAESNYSEQYNALLQDIVHSFAQRVYSGSITPIPKFQPYLQKYSADQFYYIIYLAIPNLSSLGKLVQAIDVSYLGNTDLTSGDITLSDLNFSASDYGITGKGTAKLAAGHPFPEGRMALTCSNCTHLVDDVIGYAGRVQKTMSYFQPPEQTAAATPIDSKLAEGIKGFLKALAEPSASSDATKTIYTYTIMSDGTTGITISGKNLNDILAMYKEYIGSLKVPSNVSGAPAQ